MVTRDTTNWANDDYIWLLLGLSWPGAIMPTNHTSNNSFCLKSVEAAMPRGNPYMRQRNLSNQMDEKFGKKVGWISGEGKFSWINQSHEIPQKRDPFIHGRPWCNPEKQQQDIPEMHSVGYPSLLQVTIGMVHLMCYKVGPKKDVTGVTSYNPNK